MRVTTILAATAIAVAAPALAQQTPAEPAQIAEAIRACEAITSSDWVEIKDLKGMGWEPAERRGEGMSRKVVKSVYEKEGNPTYIIVGKDELKEHSCVVTARLASTSAYGETAKGVAEIIGMPNRAEQFTYYWDHDGKQIRLDPAGEKSAPLARFQITATAQESAQ